MIEFVNRNLGKTEPVYFYRVSESVTTFGMDEGKNKAISHFEDFKGDDLHKCKAKAEKYYKERLDGLYQREYFLPFESFENFEYGKHAAFSITLSLVEYYNEEDYALYPILGETEEEMVAGRELEAYVLRQIKDND